MTYFAVIGSLFFSLAARFIHSAFTAVDSSFIANLIDLKFALVVAVGVSMADFFVVSEFLVDYVPTFEFSFYIAGLPRLRLAMTRGAGLPRLRLAMTVFFAAFS